jgi:hypothetical protein
MLCTLLDIAGLLYGIVFYDDNVAPGGWCFTGSSERVGHGRIGKPVKIRHSRATVTGEEFVSQVCTYCCLEYATAYKWEGKTNNVCSQESGDLPGARRRCAA